MQMNRQILSTFGLCLAVVACGGESSNGAESSVASETTNVPEAQSASASEPDTAAITAKFQSELEALHVQYKFPGATAAYILPDGTVNVAAVGLSDIELGIPMTPQSRMNAASIGKTITAATVLALAQEGKLRLDDPISTWLGDRPWFSRLPNHDTITLRHLLQNSAGIPDHYYMESYLRARGERWSEPGNPFPPESTIEFILDQPPLFEAGKGWAYTSTGYQIIGLIIEEVSDHSFYEEAIDRFIAPLHLSQTTPNDHRIHPGLAAGYTLAKDKFGLPAKSTIAPGVVAYSPAPGWTAGGWVSNPGDLVVWAKALYEGRAMDADYMDDLLQSVPVVDDDGPGADISAYGAGVAIVNVSDIGVSYGHGGGMPGYSSSMRYYPKHRIAVSFQINAHLRADESAPPVDEYYREMENRLAKVVAAGVEK